MRNSSDPGVQARMERLFELLDLSEAMMRQNLRRRFPEEDEAQIEKRFVAWLQDRPGAPHGDASGPFRLRLTPL